MFTEHRVNLALFAILLLAASSDLGAECVGFPLKHYKKHADLVFSGAIQGFQQLDSRRTVVTFAVDRVWKGDVGQRVVLHQLESIDSFRFIGAAIGAKYLVFATRLDARQRHVFELRKGQTPGASQCVAAARASSKQTTQCCVNSGQVERRNTVGQHGREADGGPMLWHHPGTWLPRLTRRSLAGQERGASR